MYKENNWDSTRRRKSIKYQFPLLFSLKTGFGKYVGFDSGGCLIATADAIGDRERFGVVFQDVIYFQFNFLTFFV